MKFESAKISPYRFMFMIICFLQGSSLLTLMFSSITKQDTWFAVLAALVVFMPVVAAYSALARRFPDDNLFDIFEKVYGKIAGKIISFLYLFFFLTLAALNTRDLGNFVQQTMMNNTPRIVIIGLFMLVCAWAVRNGIAVITRYSSYFAVIAGLITVLSILFTLNIMNFENFLPAFTLPVRDYVQSANIAMSIPLGELVIFLMVVPAVKLTGKQKITKYYFGGAVVGGALLTIVCLRDTGVLGNMVGRFSLPTFETLRMVSLSRTISRLEIFIAIILIILYFVKIAFLYYIVCISTAQLFGFKGFQPLVLAIGGLIMAYSVFAFESTLEHIHFGRSTSPFFWTFIECVVPVVTFFVAEARRLGKKPQKAGQEGS